MRKLIFVSLFLLLPSATHAQDCGGKERWAVKVLADEDASKINMKPESTSIGELINLETIEVNSKPPRQGIELKTYQAICKINKFKSESDADIHIVLIDPQDPTKTMIGEIPDPDCSMAKESGHAEEYKQAREQLNRFTTGKTETIKGWHYVEDGLYKIVGVGFIDYAHGQTGRAPNNIELHPILSVEKCKNEACE